MKKIVSKPLSAAAVLLLAIGCFASDLSPVMDGGKFIFVDASGKKAIDKEFGAAREFSDGLAAVNEKSARENGKWGFIDKSGRIVVAFLFDRVSDFENGAAFVEKDVNGVEKWGMIDKNGKILLDTKFYGLFKLDANLVLAKKDDKYGLFDRKGAEILPLKYQDIRSSNVDENKIFAKIDGKFGLFDAKGKSIAKPKYSDIGNFTRNKNMWASVRLETKNGVKFGLIDKSGKEVIEPKFDDEITFDEYGVAPVSIDGRRVLIDMSGKEIAKAQ
ncbi:MAG: WG repeat-containing protein [Campylobacter sp.]|nr:WG repeat-containing protein [Campylobacter sp.]